MAERTRTTISQRRLADAKKKMGEYIPGMGDDFDFYNPFDYPGAIISSAMDVGGMATDAVRGDLLGDVNYDRDYTTDDAIELGSTALSFAPVLRGLGTAAKGSKGAVNAASRGATKTYNALAGTNRKAPQIPKGKDKKPKVDLDNPGKNEIVKYDPKKAGLLSRAGQAIKNNKGKTALGAAGLAALGLMGDDDEQAPKSETPDTNKTLDNPDAGTGAEANPAPAPAPEMNLGGQAAAAAAKAVGADPAGKSPLERGKQNLERQLINLANREAKIAGDNQMADARVQAIADGRERDFRDAYNRSAFGFAELGDFDKLSPEKQAELRKQYAQSKRAGAYDSSKAARQEAMQELADTGGYYVDPNDPTNKNKTPGQVSREEFMKRSGLQNPGTFLTENRDGTFNTGETAKAFENAGGAQSAFDMLAKDNPGTMANILNQLGGDNSFTYADGSEGPAMNKGSIRTPSNMQDYGDAGFKSRDEALAYLNRKPTMDEPAPGPAEAEEDGGNFFTDYVAPLAPFAIPLLTRGKVKPKMYPGKPGTPFPKAPKPGPEPLGLPNYKTGLPNNPRGLPNNPRGLPNNLRQLEDKLPRGLPNNRMTPEQFRSAQANTGLGSGGPAIRDANSVREMNRKRFRQSAKTDDPDYKYVDEDDERFYIDYPRGDYPF